MTKGNFYEMKRDFITCVNVEYVRFAAKVAQKRNV